MMKTTLYYLAILLLFFACNSNKKLVLSSEPKVEKGVELQSPGYTESYTARSSKGMVSTDDISISGKVFELFGDTITGANIYFQSLKDGRKYTTETDSLGRYEIVLQKDCYKVDIIAGLANWFDSDTLCINENATYYVDKAFNFKMGYRGGGIGTIGVVGSGKGTSGYGNGGGTHTNMSNGKAGVKIKTAEPLILKPPIIDKSDPTEQVDINSIAQDDLNRIQTGQFRYDPIPALPIDTVYLFELEIIPGQDSAKFRAVTGNKTGAAIQKEIRIASEMSINIVSPTKAFEITQVSDSVQIIDPISSTVWRWSVVPKKLGKHPVIVSIDILTKGEETGEIRKKSIEVFNEEVEVFVIEKTPVLADTDGKGFNWLFAAIPLALALIGGLIFMFRKKQKEEKEEEWIIAPNAKALLVEVENKIADGDTETAINKLLDFFKESERLHSELLNLSAQYQTYKQEELQGLEPPRKILNRINLAIIEMVNQLQAKLPKSRGTATA